MDWAIQDSQTAVRSHLQNPKTSWKETTYFDRLKPCPENVRLDHDSDNSRPPGDITSTSRHNVTQTYTPANIGEDIELLEDDDNWENSQPAIQSPVTAPNTRYPSRDRRPPSRYDSFVRH